MPPEKLRWVLTYRPLKELDLGARCEYCEWNMAPRLRKEGIAMLLPDVQAFRGFARLLQLRLASRSSMASSTPPRPRSRRACRWAATSATRRP